MRVAELLHRLGATVLAIDPHVAAQADVGRAWERVELSAELVRASDAVVLLTDHDECDYRTVEREATWILDCRHRLTGANVENL